MPTIDLDDTELAAVISVVREALDSDKYPRAPPRRPASAARDGGEDEPGHGDCPGWR